MKLLNYCFQAVYDSFCQTEKDNGDSTELFLSLGGLTARLRFSGSSLIPVFKRVFGHVVTGPVNEPDLTVCLWDCAGGSGTAPPGPAPGGFQNYHYDGRFHVLFDLWPHRVNAFDREKGLALFWIDDAANLPWWDEAAPLRQILTWWASSRKRLMIHGGAVGTSDGGVLLGGTGGAGKTWTALACLDSPLLYAADDYCMLSAEPDPFVHSVYGIAKLKNRTAVKRFPELEPLILNKDKLDEEKAMIDLHSHHPEKIARGFPVKAVLLLRQSDGGSFSFKKAGMREALSEILRSTAKQCRGFDVSDFQLFYRILSRVPCYEFSVGNDLSRIPAMITDLLSGRVL